MSRTSLRSSLQVFTVLALMGLCATRGEAGSLQWLTSYEKAQKQAVAESKPILAMFTASWCGPCKRMKSTTLSDAGVESALAEHFVPVMIDTDENRSVTRKFGISAMPTILVIHPVTEATQSVRGFQSKGEFLAFLNRNKQSVQLASGNKPASEATSPIQQVNQQQADNGTLLTPFCLVSIVEDGKLEDGLQEFSTTYEGLTVRFGSASKRERFLEKPDAYWPQLQGNCPVSLKDTGERVRGEARWAVEYDGQLFFCQTRENALKFVKKPTSYLAEEVKVGLKKQAATPGASAVN
ncbi:MAG: thioredoxin domain-containing protein [Planctomycetaceae bacterium]|nr:thioredoxin family protein [Planctomycetaceae bacterium]